MIPIQIILPTTSTDGPMNTDPIYQIRLNLAQCATARAHIYGAESMLLQEESEALFKASADPKLIGHSVSTELAARRRYWREVSAAAILAGGSWPEAQRLGGVKRDGFNEGSESSSRTARQMEKNDYLIAQGAQWGWDQREPEIQATADAELEACCEWVQDYAECGDSLRAARRPKPPSLKAQALQALRQVGNCEEIDNVTFETIRRALEQLDD